jgi:SAM-dependent methyltransferase
VTIGDRETAPAAAPKSIDDWDAHWSSYADSAAANPAQAYRRKLVLDALDLDRAPGPVRLLELGSGQGDFARDLAVAHPGIEICGLDLAETGVAIARRKVPGGAFFQQDFTQPLAIPAQYHGWATHAVCSEVLEHVDDPGAVLANVRALMAPGCRLVFTVPGGPMSAFDRHIGHRVHFTADRLAQTLRSAGLDVADLRGAGFPFFNLYRLAVVARGEKLIQDASADDGRTLPLTARATIKVFSWLFRMNQHTGRRGWQMVAVAVEPPATASG